MACALFPQDWSIVRYDTRDDFSTSSESKISGLTVHTLSDALRIAFFHSAERIQKQYLDSLPILPDTCGRKQHPERKKLRIQNIRIRVDGA